MDDYKRDNSCFKCGKTRHYIAQCPLGNNSNNHNGNRNFHNSTASAIKPPQVARVHHMSTEEANEDLGVMMGMC